MGWLSAFDAGEPDVTPFEQRASRGVVVAATVFLAAIAAWGIAGPVLAGHDAAAAGMGIIAENMHRWGIAGPVWTYGTTAPSPAQYYCHHPWGTFWTTRLFYELLGRHDVVCRLPAVVLSTLTVPLVAALARALYRPYAGALAALTFVSLPIELSFAGFNALEVPLMAYAALFLWGWVRLVRTSRPRYAVAAFVGATLALDTDWPAFLLVGAVLGLDLLDRALRPTPAPRLRSTLWLATAGAAVVVLAAYAALFSHAGQLDELWRTYGARSAGNRAPLSVVLASRRFWIELMFTPVAVLVGKVFVPVPFLRALAGRRAVELVPLAVLFMAGVQYVVFKEGADVHVFWPQCFALYAALASAGLFATIARVVPAWSARAPRRPWVYALAMLMPVVLVLRDGLSIVPYARATGGRFDERGLRITSDGDKNAVLRWLASRSPDATIGLHPSMHPDWSSVWALGGRPVELAVAASPSTPGALTVVDARFVSDVQRAGLARRGVTSVGPFWIVDGAGTRASLSLATREPSLVEWLLRNGTEPVRTVVPDPFADWEMRAHYESPPPLLDGTASTPEHHRVLHNVALLAGDEAGVAREWEAAARGCKPVGVTFPDGTTLLCARFEDGVAPTLTFVFSTRGPLAAGTELSIVGRITQGARLSTTMVDPHVRELSMPFTLSPSLFRAGFLYSHTVTLRRRPGAEEVLEAALRTGAEVTPRVEVWRW
jgi:hypothetical protein